MIIVTINYDECIWMMKVVNYDDDDDDVVGGGGGGDDDDDGQKLYF